MANEIIPVIRTSEGLRDMLFEELDNLRAGNTSTQHAQAICRVSTVIVNSILAEIQYHKALINGKERENVPSTVLQLGQVKKEQDTVQEVSS